MSPPSFRHWYERPDPVAVTDSVIDPVLVRAPPSGFWVIVGPAGGAMTADCEVTLPEELVMVTEYEPVTNAV